MNNSEKRQLADRFTKIRMKLLKDAPFYGELLLKLRFGLAPCQTACTDMERILFDPQFMQRLSDLELEFVVLHELLHCVLNHPIRRHSRLHTVFNIAADIVVNSIILKHMGSKTFTVDGEAVMHTLSDGSEGYLFSAEEVYQILLQEIGEMKIGMKASEKEILDAHDIWESVSNTSSVPQEWELSVKQIAGKMAMREGIPGELNRNLKEIRRKPRLNWKELLQNFIQMSVDGFDYTFQPYDRRFADSPFILPGFTELEQEKVSNLWFLVDTSGSIQQEQLETIMAEISAALTQFQKLEARISYFDAKVSAPVRFSNQEELKKFSLMGGGGTSFSAIFQYLQENMSEQLPVAMIILTDGYSIFPTEEAALGVPVLWIMVGSERKAPFGTTIFLPLASD